MEGAELLEHGEIKRDMLDDLKAGLHMSRAIIEIVGPWISGAEPSVARDLTNLLIKEFGPNVNLANVMPDEIFHTEALRVGLSVVQPTEVLVCEP